MPEDLPSTPEQNPEPVRLPLPPALSAAYGAVYGELVRSEPDFVEGATSEVPSTQVLLSATGRTWWATLSNRLSGWGFDRETATNLQLAARHSADFDYKGQPTGGGFTLFELGPEEDRRAVEVVLKTLELIDQFSGGAMAASPSRFKVILNNQFRIHTHSYKNLDGSRRENLGISYEDMIMINMPYMRELAAEHPGTDFYNLLATTVVHEVLAHPVERAVEGDDGLYFRKYFNYSQLGPGERYPQVYQSITPIDEGVTDTQPVREMSKLDPKEDLAVSLEEAIAYPMGWSETNRNSPRFANRLDPYRDDLVLKLLQQAAEMAKNQGHAGLPGYVGSEVYYVDGHPQPARTMHVSSSYGPDALQQELRAVMAAVVSSRHHNAQTNKNRPNNEG